jgi:hypothetical protein
MAVARTGLIDRPATVLRHALKHVLRGRVRVARIATQPPTIDGETVTPAPTPPRLRRLARFALAGLALASIPSTAAAATPDPLERGSYAVTEVQQYKAGTVNLQEPSSTGGTATGVSAAATLQVRGSLYYPTNRLTPAPFILLVHGNHGSCQIAVTSLGVPSGGSAPNCTIFERNDLGYGYLASNLASHGYVVASIDQDQLMYYQDNGAKGMHQRRLMIAAQLDAFYEANQTALPDDADHNLGGSLVGRIDFNHVGLMGHSRGGDAVSSFMDYNRTRPAPGRRYNISGVISLAPVDYERRAPYGSAYLTILPACDGDVSNLQGARFFERSQYANAGDPFPKIQMYLLGANHNYFNTVWSADADDDGTVADAACGNGAANTSTSIRLTGGTTVGGSGQLTSLLGTYTRANAFSSDQALVGDQERIGLATMSAFFRRYVGNETDFDPYMTGELSTQGDGNELPASACPTSPTGTRISCDQYLQTNYFAPAAEREDVIGPDVDNPTSVSALGTSITASGFANPYTDAGGVSPKPLTTTSGVDWCNPEPNQFTPVNLGITGYPLAAKPCPLPNAAAVGGQASNRENGPVNQSYGMQLSLAWDHPTTPATLATRIPAADGDLSGKKALALSAAVNYFDTRNPDRSGDAQWNPSLAKQDFGIQLTDAAGKTAIVHAGARRYGTALAQTTGSANARVHIILNQIRVPLADFTGVDLTNVRKIEFLFGGSAFPASGSIQMSDVRFQEATTGPTALTGRNGSEQSAAVIADTPRDAASASNPDVITVGASAAAVATCTDKTAPVAKVAKKKALKGKLTISGSATDAGCGTVKTVQLRLTKGSGKSVRYVTAAGKLGKAPVTLVAKGTGTWSLKTPKLAKGTYGVSVLTIDAAGNTATKQAGSVTVR